MSKYKALGGVNTLLSFFFIFILTKSTYSNEPLVSFGSFIHAYAPNGVLFFSLCMNALLAYKLLVKKDHKLSFFLYVVLTLVTVLWFLLLFIGFFFASHIMFPIVSLAFIISIFYFVGKSSKKIAITLSLITLLVSGVVIISSFEEDYCWAKGEEADATGSKFVITTKEDAQALKELKGFNIKEGAQIGVSFRAHFLCHNTFSLVETIKEKYSLRK